MQEQQARREREQAEIKAERMGIADPMSHLHRNGGRESRASYGGGGGRSSNLGLDGGYSPSMLETSPRRGQDRNCECEHFDIGHQDLV